MRILATDGMDKSGVLALTQKGHEVVEQFYAPEELGEKVREFDVLVVRSATKVRVPTIDAAKGSKLKLIIRGGVGVDNIDVEYAEKNGIAVRNTPRASSDSVAELALAHMFSVARFISAAGHTMRENKWEKKAYGGGIELADKTVGIIGYGRIGQALGRRCMALGMKVLAYDVYKIPSLECEAMKYVELDELLENSDFVSLHTPSLDGKPLINADTIAKMKTGAVHQYLARQQRGRGGAHRSARQRQAARRGSRRIRRGTLQERGALQPSQGILHAAHRRGHGRGPKAHRRGDRRDH